jgi:CRISPR-associated endonuclease/helicase Cas3
MEYKDFFQTAFGNAPFDYQIRFATGARFDDLVKAPTGAGKTATVIGGFLWKRLHHSKTIGRRLVYCLPMRTLVEQTRDVTNQAIKKLEEAGLIEKGRFRVYVLMGGDVSDEWDTEPEKECILIGTQDMLLSRALNRGYAMSRYRWPLHFGLLNNDCLWVYDEVQLMSDGLATSTQMAALRERFQTIGLSQSIWMSATLSNEWLRSIDFVPKINDLKLLELSAEDRATPILAARLTAHKSLQPAPEQCRQPDGLAAFVQERHQAGTQTLVVVNRVNRAKETYTALQDLYHPQPKKPKKGASRILNPDAPEIILIHSRFRPEERKRWKQVFENAPASDRLGRIIVATQVVEAGVDISSRLLVTDLAPYSSLVQRFGRCNRKGEFSEANVFWVDRPLEQKHDKLNDKAEDKLEEKDQKTIAAPYAWEQLQKAGAIIRELTSAAPQDLPDYHDEYTPTHVLRKRDIVELFDTTPDLSGFDLDVSRFVRGGEERDVSVAWRPLDGKQPERNIPALTRDELCPVPLYEFKTFLKKETPAWIWDPLAVPDNKRKAVGLWVKFTEAMLRPGISILLDSSSGAYSPEVGWDLSSKEAVRPVAPEVKEPEEAYPDDLLSELSYTQTLTAHSAEAKARCQEILTALQDLPLDEWRDELTRATHHHDWGKAHPVFQRTLHGTEEVLPVYERLLAKSQRGGKHTRPHFRHELASALALLQSGASDLTVYLAACHHGKVRLGIRSLTGEQKPSRTDAADDNAPPLKFARGIWDQDELPAADLGDGVITPAITLNLEPMQLGASGEANKSWLERMISLRERIGIFRLTFLECLIRAADVRASKYPVDKEVL